MFRAIVTPLALSVTFSSHITQTQTFRGAIQGTVTDSSGSAIAGAQVTVVTCKEHTKQISEQTEIEVATA
jgi:hypothetical protein